MSVEDELIKGAVDAAIAGAKELLTLALNGNEEHYQRALDELAERAKFEAEGNRKLAARRKT